MILAANSRLLDILLSESKRLKMVVKLMLHLCGWDINFDTPRLRALECDFLVLRLSKFYAPNISRLHLNTNCHYLASALKPHISFHKDLHHLRLRNASVCALCSTITSFPIYFPVVSGARIYSATLKSMTLLLPSSHESHHFRQEFIDMSSLIHLPQIDSRWNTKIVTNSSSVVNIGGHLSRCR
ncbi:uncharacterized protein HD556DRAFT_129489 [Suillus plorans]|uniref:Uncharacterized protein n=1 Tax=Suillus plorans TaxID=116603 RepID=A0A9P7DP47_9AGAM|nr:uncharacterized protein HD556DRAFT_129489 [Suillus plorans]KAG1799461.1 hypothetical protein HD556DRAFT_129489 [Suillus plorans]